MQNGSDRENGNNGAQAPKTGVPPVVGHRDGDGRVILDTRPAPAAPADRQKTEGNAAPAPSPSTMQSVPAPAEQPAPAGQSEPSARLKKVATKQNMKIAGVILAVYGICCVLFLSIVSSVGSFGVGGGVGAFNLIGPVVVAIIALVIGFLSRMNDWEREVLRRKKRAWKAAARLDGKSRGKDIKKMLTDLIKAGNEPGFDKLAGEWKGRADAYALSLMQTRGMRAVNAENDGKGGFDGKLIQKIGWNILSGLVVLLTVGIAYPVTLVWKEKWRCKHTLYDGKRLSFDGTAAQLIGNWLLWLLLVSFTAGIFLLFIPGRVKKWKAKHTHIAGEHYECGATFDGWFGQQALITLFGAVISVLTLGLALPATATASARWRATHTVLDGRRLTFDGKGVQLFGNYIKWWLLSVVTLGIYAWFIPNRLRAWKAKHTHYENEYELN